MMDLKYAGGVIVLSDAACHALLGYAAALADRATSDNVLVPVVDDGNGRVTADILIGPASQLFAVPSAEPSQEMDDSEIIAYMERETARLQPAGQVTAEQPVKADASLDSLLGDL